MASNFLYIFCLAFFSTGLLKAQMSVTLMPSKDNTIYLSPQDDPLSNGAGSRLFAGRSGDGTLQRALLQFDVAGAVPANAQIESVELMLRRVMVAPSGDGRTLSLHRLEKEWGEGASVASMGQGKGAAPADGDATWVHAFFGTDLWDQEGGDFAASASGSAQTGSGNTISFGSTAGMVTDVQTWLDNPAVNFGWIVLGDESVDRTANGIGSREGSSSAAPQLVIQYSMSTGTRKVLGDVVDLNVWPNPSRDRFFFEFTLREKSSVQLTVYDLLGKQVYAMPAQALPSGPQRLHWDGRDRAGKILEAGFYIYELSIGHARIGGRLLRRP